MKQRGKPENRANEVTEVAQAVPAQAEQVVEHPCRNGEGERDVDVLGRGLKEEDGPRQVADEDEEPERGDQGQMSRAALADRLFKEVSHPVEDNLDDLLHLARIVPIQPPRHDHPQRRHDTEDEQRHDDVIRHLVGEALLGARQTDTCPPDRVHGLVEDGVFAGSHDRWGTSDVEGC